MEPGLSSPAGFPLSQQRPPGPLMDHPIKKKAAAVKRDGQSV